MGGALLIIGLLSRPLAVLLAIDMLTATLVVHVPNGFYVGNSGVEFTLLLMTICVTIVLAGPGRPSVDAILGDRRAATSPAATPPSSPPSSSPPAA